MKKDHLKVTTLNLKLYLTDPNIRCYYFLGYPKNKKNKKKMRKPFLGRKKGCVYMWCKCKCATLINVPLMYKH